MKKLFSVALLLVLMLSACGPSQALNPTVDVTKKPLATLIADIPTQTPTLTLTASLTPPPATYTLTAPPSATLTLTPLPATQTANAANVNATGTAVQASIILTSTAQVKAYRATQEGNYKKINAQELISHPDDHIGELVVIKGQIINVINNRQFQLLPEGLSNNLVAIVMSSPFDDIFRTYYVTVYGVVSQKVCATLSSGVQVCQPVIRGDYYEFK